MVRSVSGALPIATALLKVAIVLNWLMAAAIVALLVAMPNRRWIMSAFDLVPSPEADRIILALRVVAMLGLVVVPLYHVVLKRLLAMVASVRDGDPFVADNAARLNLIAWALLALQCLGIVIGAIGKAVSTAERPIHLGAGFSLSGWLAVLLTFVLARVFAEGTRMRDDLAGTV